MSKPPENFTPPTAEQVRQHLADNPAEAPSPWIGRLPLLALVVLAGLVLLTDPAIALPVGALLLAGALGAMVWRSRYLRRLRQALQQCQEAALLRHYRWALSRAWRLLPQVRRQPQLHGRTVALLGHLLDELACYEAALTVYDHLLPRLNEDHPGRVQLQTQRAVAALGCDQLTDAYDALRVVSHHIDPAERTPTSAGYHLAVLFQQVRTHHYREAIEPGEDLLPALRPLGVEAGYGHALMAFSHRQLREIRPSGEAPADQVGEEAETPEAGLDHTALMRRWWDRATLLLPPAAIVHRFPELAPLAEETSA